MFKSILHGIIVASAFLCQFGNVAMAQDDYTIVTQDLEAWTSVGVKYKANKKLSMGLYQGFRFNTNASSTDQILTEIGLKYAFTKNLYFGTDLRYIADKSSSGDFNNDFRFNLDFGIKHDFKRFDFKYRLRYQNKNEIGYSKSEGDDAENLFRLKVSTEYNIKNWKLDPQFSAEIFRDVGGNDANFQKVRFSVETNYKIKKIGEVNPFYMIERELNQTYPKTTYIIGVNYTYSFKKKQ